MKCSCSRHRDYLSKPGEQAIGSTEQRHLSGGDLAARHRPENIRSAGKRCRRVEQVPKAVRLSGYPVGHLPEFGSGICETANKIALANADVEGADVQSDRTHTDQHDWSTRNVAASASRTVAESPTASMAAVAEPEDLGNLSPEFAVRRIHRNTTEPPAQFPAATIGSLRGSR